MLRRELLTAGAGLGLGLATTLAATAPVVAQPARREVKRRTAKTVNLFKAPAGYPNAMDRSAEGMWVAEQKMVGTLAAQYKVPEPTDKAERVWLLDWNTGKVLKTVATQASNISGLAYGEGYLWACANYGANGVYQTDLNSKTVAVRAIPLGAKDNNGGGSHGAFYQDGKVWIMSNRLRGIVKIDAKTWTPEFIIPATAPRFHDICWGDDGTVWLITGENSTSFAAGKQGLQRFDAASGLLLEEVTFEPGSADPHGLTIHKGVMYSCDAGIHPGWPADDSPHTGQIFRIDIT